MVYKTTAANLRIKIDEQEVYIAELKAENKTLREKLTPFAYDVAECFQDDEDTEITVKIRDIRAARTALNGEKE
jgi:hypothetical protein